MKNVHSTKSIDSLKKKHNNLGKLWRNANPDPKWFKTKCVVVNIGYPIFVAWNIEDNIDRL